MITVVNPRPASEDTRWIVHGRRNLYTSEWIRLDMTDVELPDGSRFEHHRLDAAVTWAAMAGAS
jgi:hypothetical protein